VKLYDGTWLPGIDRGIAYLVRLLNRSGLRTVDSCEGTRLDGNPGPCSSFAYVAVKESNLAVRLAVAMLSDRPFIKSRPIRGSGDESWFSIRVSPADGVICFEWQWEEHRLMVRRFKRALEKIGLRAFRSPVSREITPSNSPDRKLS